jgi:hypothetical protein
MLKDSERKGADLASVDYEDIKALEQSVVIPAFPEMYEALKRALKDMDVIDQTCQMAGAHPFTLMRADIEQALAKAEGK